MQSLPIADDASSPVVGDAVAVYVDEFVIHRDVLVGDARPSTHAGAARTAAAAVGGGHGVTLVTGGPLLQAAAAPANARTQIRLLSFMVGSFLSATPG